MVVPPERRATPQTARQGASPFKTSDVLIRLAVPAYEWGFDALARATLLRALQMRYGHSARRASRIRANASETRLMGKPGIGSG